MQIRMTGLSFAAAAALWVCCGTIQAADDPEGGYELRIFDVSDLIATPIDYPAPSYVLGLISTNIVDPFATAPASKSLNASDLVTLIHDRLMAASFADPATSIAENDGQLVVMQRKQVLRQIAQYLVELRKTEVLQLAVKGLLVPVAEAPAATQFTSDELAKLIGPQGASNAVAAPRIVCANNQLVHVRSGRLYNYIRDYDVAGAVYDPVVSSGLDGYILEVKPTLNSERTAADMTVRFTYSNRTSMAARNIILAPPIAPALLSANADGRIAERAAARPVTLPIDLPTASIQSIVTSLRAPLGKWVLAGVLNNPNPEAKEKRLLFLISTEKLNPNGP